LFSGEGRLRIAFSRGEHPLRTAVTVRHAWKLRPLMPAMY
jgi:hypothetical protein